MPEQMEGHLEGLQQIDEHLGHTLCVLVVHEQALHGRDANLGVRQPGGDEQDAGTSRNFSETSSTARASSLSI